MDFNSLEEKALIYVAVVENKEEKIDLPRRDPRDVIAVGVAVT